MVQGSAAMSAFVTENPPALYRPWTPASEKDFERQIVRYARWIFPDFKVGPWTPIIRDWYGRSAQPDLVLVSNDLQMWYVVEVELSSHSVTSHISPQLETLNKGIYDLTLLPSLRKAVEIEDSEALKRLIYRTPGRLCIVEAYSEKIHTACREHDFELVVLEPYLEQGGRSGLNIQLMPSTLRHEREANRYQLGRGATIGNKEFMTLPPHFPAWQGEITIVTLEGCHKGCRIHSDIHGRKLIVEGGLVPHGKAIQLQTVDFTQRLFQVEVM